MEGFEHPRVNVLGVGVSALNMSDAVQLSDSFVQSGGKGYICVTGVHGVMEAQADPSFRAIQNRSLITTPDGMPTVWIGHLQGHKQMSQVCGPEFMLEFCALAARRGYKHFLYGGQVGVAEQLKAALVDRFPGLKIVGTFTPPFRALNADEEKELYQKVRDSEADILWCGISTPRQERFMAQYVDYLPVKLMIGVGAAFDINSGRQSDAPKWLKRSGLNWFYRLLQEPRRLWRRYLYNNPKFLWLFFLQLLKVRRHDISQAARQ
jgi:N-acetylglucosaminyldiphosphoundecaprenol N-acetyl-beta-D-mannosaminyltransferase